VFDSKGGLHTGRDDLRQDSRFYRKWDICKATNPNRIDTVEEACKGADILCSLSTPGPDVVKKHWISSMADKAIVFTCANPVPEIYPHDAKDAGAYIVATGRSDFPNQVNNSMCFPGLLKGCLLVRASRVTDTMAVAAAHSLARAQQRAVSTSITSCRAWTTWRSSRARPPTSRGRPRSTAWPAPDGLRRGVRKAEHDIRENREIVDLLMESGKIPQPPKSMIDAVLAATVDEIRGKVEAVKGSADE